MKVFAIILVLLPIVLQVNSQINYVPLPVIIHFPQINNTNLNTTSHFDNKTGYWNWNQTSKHGDLIVGQIGYMDRLLFNQMYFKSGRWWSSREKIIEYPKDLPGGYVRHETISSIRIYNKFYDGLNSKAEIVTGGIGHRYVKIRLSSNWGKGFQYLVQIYGH